MDTARLTFYDPTNFTLPYTIFQTLVEDAFYFGYVKNEQANVSGLLNRLIPCLSDYREDLHNNLLAANGQDEVLTNKIEENIYKVYFNKYDYCDDGVVSVPFRVNKEYLQAFLDIYDRRLGKYNMDFTGYVRSLLIEYTSKRLHQREYFFFYKQISEIKEAINRKCVCYFYTAEEKISFVPVTIELLRGKEINLIVGFNIVDEVAHFLPLSLLQRVVVTETEMDLSEEQVDFTYSALEEYIDELEEVDECSD